jgi:hypothetical protein
MQNVQLRESYDQHQLRLAAVVVADIFIDGELETLWAALRGPLGRDRPGSEDASRVRDFLRRSASRTVGGAALGPIRFRRSDGPRKGFRSHEMSLPTAVDEVTLGLYQFAPGMVMASMVAAVSPTLAEDVFHLSHSSPTSPTLGGGISFKYVEAAKGADLASHFQTIADIGLLPTGAGFLNQSRYPSGTVVVWMGSPPADDNARSWHDVCRVLGIENWRWWEGPDLRLYTGVPEAEHRPQDGGDGYSILDTRQKPTSNEAETFTPEGIVRHELGLEIYDWLPLLLMLEAAQLITGSAGRLRERLNRGTTTGPQPTWPIVRLGRLVADLHNCEYRLERLRQAAGLDDKRSFRQFPTLILKTAHRPDEQVSRSKLLERLERLAHKQPPPDEPARHLRNDAIEWLDSLTKSGRQDVGLSLERARLLAQLRSTTALLFWTAWVGILTAILVFRELAR